MASRPGKLYDRSSGTYRLVADIVRAAEGVTGRRSNWSGDVAEERSRNTAGSAHPDGLMTVQPRAMDRLKAIESDAEVSARELIALRDTVITLTHEASHLITRDGDLSRPDAHPVKDRAAIAMDEGLAETWAHQAGRRIVLAVGLDSAYPELAEIGSGQFYPGYAPAVNDLVTGLATEAGRHPDDVTQDLMLTDRSQKWNAAADMMMDARLRGVVPAEHQGHVRAMLAEDLRDQFGRLDNAEHIAEPLRRDTARDVGRTAVDRMGRIADSVRAHYQAHQGPGLPELPRSPLGKDELDAEAASQPDTGMPEERLRSVSQQPPSIAFQQAFADQTRMDGKATAAATATGHDGARANWRRPGRSGPGRSTGRDR